MKSKIKKQLLFIELNKSFFRVKHLKGGREISLHKVFNNERSLLELLGSLEPVYQKII